MALPRGLGGRCHRRKIQQAGLLTRIAVDTQGVVVLPADVQACGQAHQSCGAEGPALFAVGVVLFKVPFVRNLPAARIDRDAGDVAFRRRHHAPKPVFGDERHPATADVDLGGLARAARRWWLKAARWLRDCGNAGQRQHCAGKEVS